MGRENYSGISEVKENEHKEKHTFRQERTYVVDEFLILTHSI